jgi:hypothetical protein
MSDVGLVPVATEVRAMLVQLRCSMGCLVSLYLGQEWQLNMLLSALQLSISSGLCIHIVAASYYCPRWFRGVFRGMVQCLPANPVVRGIQLVKTIRPPTSTNM